MVYISKLERNLSKDLEKIGRNNYEKAHAEESYNKKKLDPIYREMQKETDKLKYKHRRELRINM